MHERDVVCVHAQMEDCVMVLFARVYACACRAYIAQSFTLTIKIGAYGCLNLNVRARSERAKRAKRACSF